MQLSLQTFTSLVQNMAAAVQSTATQLLDLTVGSTLRAVLEANASVALWIQWLILQVLQMTRAATSIGTDLDSWMADMSLSRLPAVPAVGVVTFSRYTATASSFVPAGALVLTGDGTLTFVVTTDTTNSVWNAALDGYTISPGVGSITVPIVAQTLGSAGNVLANTISLIATAMPGIDLVTNPAATQNGLNPETDAAFRSRFQNYLQSRSRATVSAVGYAITSIQQGLDFIISENVDPSGASWIGSFVITVDDGSGYPPSSLLSTVYSSVDSVRPIGSIFSVQPPSVVQANVTLTLSIINGANNLSVISTVTSAVTGYVNSLTIGELLPLTRIAQVAYDASNAVVNVTQLQVNGGMTDLVPGDTGIIKAGSVSVN
jgi:uncharacterized phage protein gp47/JayE